MLKLLPTFLLWLGLIPAAPSAHAALPPSIDAAELERQIHQQINRERQKQGLAPLGDDEGLVAIARNHSLDMARHHFFNHVNLRGELPSDRARRQGWNQRKQIAPATVAVGIAENIFLARLYEKIYTLKENGITVGKEYEWTDTDRLVQTIVQGWMDSPHHRKVMLSSQYDRQGIGVVISEYDVYVTENLF
ncbi:CAP domain-containing protein [Methylomicrobium sp. RS1]|jgi:uncharacterized protein YkwD|uniref:CAP domain-containing protein n=1 Tax=Candidatus Methylomicrobium oryzae TaxID=2802053 RepID=UPI0019214E5A|nr:CAP domain-containing protein [Methylomicrobium sp. RS1]MBL1263264.1 CAP domain-containing protein [Methylomicrobium sp. RS1]